MSRKEFLAKTLDYFLPDCFYRYLSRISGNKNKLVVLAYHRILDFDENFPYDIELISASTEQFEQQIKFISKHCNPVSIEQVVEAYKSKSALPDNSVLITFDDGFSDNYYFAFPVLKKYNVPATIFISTDYIGNDDTLWFDKLAYVIKNTQSDTITSKILNKVIKLKTTDQRESVLEDFLEDLKVIPDQKRLDALAELFALEEVTLNTRDKNLSGTLNWEQIIEMDNSCISFGSHTVSHPILTQLSSEELIRELKESKSIIEEHLSHPITTIAYPVGMSFSFNKEVLEATKQAGYSLGFSYMPGVNSWPLMNNYALRRLHVERYTSTPFFKCMISVPMLFNY